MKGIIKVITRTKRYKTRPLRLLYKRIVRDVKDVEKIKSVDGEPILFDIQDEMELYWASKLTWTLYRGVIQYRKNKTTVYGWSYNDHHPVVWGCDKRGECRPSESGWKTLWDFISRRDLPDHKLAPRNSYAFILIRDKFGLDFAEKYLGIPEDHKCKNCDYGGVDREAKCDECFGTGVV